MTDYAEAVRNSLRESARARKPLNWEVAGDALQIIDDLLGFVDKLEAQEKRERPEPDLCALLEDVGLVPKGQTPQVITAEGRIVSGPGAVK